MDDAKRLIDGEPEEYDSFENAWYDDEDPAADEREVADNKKFLNVLTRPLADAFSRAICAAKSLREARAIVSKHMRFCRDMGSGESDASALGGAIKLMRGIEAMARGGTPVRRMKSQNKEVVRYGDAYPIFSAGNIKLPFWTWSKLPVHTCPGKGACRSYCYSLKHTGQPAPLYTWTQNTLLAHFRRDAIEEALEQLEQPTVLRLHVDGDFETADEIAWWMQALKRYEPTFNGREQTGGISSYAYSKSWKQLVEYGDRVGEWPSGFWINISAGGKWDNDAAMLRRVRALPCVRGEFIVIDDARIPHRSGLSWVVGGISEPMPADKAGREEQKSRIARIKLGLVIEDMKKMFGGSRTGFVPYYSGGKRKWYPCPGKCATCVKHGNTFSHACGSEEFKDVVIGIGIH